MKTTNIPAGSQRLSNVGLVWKEIYSNGSGTFRVKFQQTIRVHAVAQTTIDIDGVRAITLEAGETEYINSGTGAKGDERSTLEIIVTGTANISVASEEETGRRTR